MGRSGPAICHCLLSRVGGGAVAAADHDVLAVRVGVLLPLLLLLLLLQRVLQRVRVVLGRVRMPLLSVLLRLINSPCCRRCRLC